MPLCSSGLQTGACVKRYTLPPDVASDVEFTGAALHPDGLVWATAERQNYYLRMWDFRNP